MEGIKSCSPGFSAFQALHLVAIVLICEAVLFCL